MGVLTWITVVGMSFQLLQSHKSFEYYKIEQSWMQIDTLGFVSKPNQKAMLLTLKHKTTGKELCKFAIIPRQDLHAKAHQTTKFPESIDQYFVTANEFAIAYSINTHSLLDENEKELARQFQNHLFKLFEGNEYEKPQNEEVPNTSVNGMQIISYKEFKHYIIIEATEQGSLKTNPIYPEEIASNKPIYLFVSPDIGAVKIHWLYPEFLNMGNCYPDILKKYYDALSEFKKNKTKIDIEPFFKKKLIEIKGFIDSLNCELPTTIDLNFFKNLFLIENPIESYEENEIFPDYQPKTSPDLVTDFRPSISEIISTLPSNELQLLPELLDLYEKYQQIASKNKGNWEEGNIVLGAKPQEYNPSDDELILSEIGERIYFIVDQNEIDEIKKVLKKSKVKVNKISFTKFTFTHVDVMGSGRFFYVEDMKEYTILLK